MVDPYPPLRLTRLITWGYRKLHEEAWPHLRILLTLGPEQSGLKEQIGETKELLNSLRTCEQHWLSDSPPNGPSELRRAQEWFNRACGTDSPEEWQLEQCAETLLQTLESALRLIRNRLEVLDVDPYREMLLEQWRERREVIWPEHRLKTFLRSVLNDLGRTDNAEALFNKLRKPMQDELSRLAGVAERERELRMWLEDELQNFLPPENARPRRGLDCPRSAARAGG